MPGGLLLILPSNVKSLFTHLLLLLTYRMCVLYCVENRFFMTGHTDKYIHILIHVYAS